MLVSPPRWGRRLARMATAAIIAAAITAMPSAARADDATREDIYGALGLSDDITAHYVVLVDTSGSMESNNLYQYVREGLTRFVKAVDPADTVTIMSFADEPSEPCFAGSVTEPEEVLTCLPRKATGTATDIGRAIDAAIRDVRENAAQVSVVLLISDGDQQAPDTSPYGAPSLKSAQWAALRKRADALKNTYAYALQLGKSTSARTLGVVFRNTKTLSAASPTQVKSGLAPPKDEVLTKAMRAAVTPDLAKPVKISWSTDTSKINAADGSADIALTIESTTENLPLSLTDVSLRQIDGTHLTIDPMPSTIDLLPGFPYVVAAHVTWPVPPWPRLTDHPVNVLSHLELTVNVTSSWDKVLKEEGLTRTTVVQGDRQLTLAGSGVAGRSIEFIIGVPVILIGLVVGVIALVRRRGRRSTPPTTSYTGVVYQRALP